jgi:hypothetical protein
MNHIYAAFYTRDSPYENEIKKLIKSLEQFNLEYVIKDYPCRKDWRLNIHYKSECILSTMNEYPEKNVIYVDADATIMSLPKLFFTVKEDWMAHIRNNRRNARLFLNGEMLSGTLYFANNNHTKKFVELWHKKSNSKSDGVITEQHLLQMMYNDKIHLKMGLTFRQLPGQYCQIFDYMKTCGDPIIEHHQLSRITKKFFKNKYKIIQKKKRQKGLGSHPM